MGRLYRLAICCLLTTACQLIAGPCEQETRYVARVESWNVVCLAPKDGLQSCAVWPAIPPAPDWVGGATQADSGYPLRPVVVCRETRITDTPL